MGEKPVKNIRIGGISASVFRNTNKTKDGREFTTHSIIINRSYKNKEGVWQTTSSFRENDIAKLQLLCNELQHWIFLEQPAESADTQDNVEKTIEE